MYVSKEGYTRFFFLFGDEKERSVLRVAMLLCSEKKNEIDFGQLHLIPHPLLLSRSLARALSLCLSISLPLSLYSPVGLGECNYYATFGHSAQPGCACLLDVMHCMGVVGGE